MTIQKITKHIFTRITELNENVTIYVNTVVLMTSAPGKYNYTAYKVIWAVIISKKIATVDAAPTLFERIWKGFMPGIVSGLYPECNMHYSSYHLTYYLLTYVERDVRDISGTVDAS